MLGTYQEASPVNCCCWPIRTMARTLLLVTGIVLSLVLLSGCDTESYSEGLRYPTRTDPIVSGTPPLEATPEAPDTPGQMPLTSLADLADLKHPLNQEPGLENKILSPAKLSAEQRGKLETLLEKAFGTPANPKVAGIDTAAVSLLKLDEATLAEGSRLYRRHCLHCHGLTGDGRGPTAPWVNPHPRDYRQGVFKFTSTKLDLGVRKARRDDLLRTLRQGIEGTSMPSFVLLHDNELEALVSYVIHLSLRGEVEYETLKTILTVGLEGTIDEAVQQRLTVFGQRWVDNEQPENHIAPDPYPYDRSNTEQMRASARRGWNLFKLKTDAGCIGCHEDYGRKLKFTIDSWGTLVRRTDLTLGIYRGGRRPIDLYWRVHSGINGSFMPSFGNVLVPDEKQKAKGHPLWDMVNFLQVLPYPRMREQYGIDIDEKLPD